MVRADPSVPPPVRGHPARRSSKLSAFPLAGAQPYHDVMNTNDNVVVDLPVDECWTLLRRYVVGRLAVTADGAPDIFPVNYATDHGSVVFRTAEGTKLAAAVGAAVAFEVDGYDSDAGEAWSVVVKGTAEQVRRQEELLATTDLPLFPWHAWPKPRFVRIVPGSVTGRRFHTVDREAWHNQLAGSHRSAPE